MYDGCLTDFGLILDGFRVDFGWVLVCVRACDGFLNDLKYFFNIFWKLCARE